MNKADKLQEKKDLLLFELMNLEDEERRNEIDCELNVIDEELDELYEKGIKVTPPDISIFNSNNEEYEIMKMILDEEV